jgi:transposase
MELQLEELEADAGEDELSAEMVAKGSTVMASERKRPSRKPFPEHLPRERVVIAAPTNCSCCGSAKLSKLGEDITETLEVIPRQWKVIQTVREKFSCRECEKITQPPAPFHVTPRGFAGPNLLAMLGAEVKNRYDPRRGAVAGSIRLSIALAGAVDTRRRRKGYASVYHRSELPPLPVSTPEAERPACPRLPNEELRRQSQTAYIAP